MRNKRYKIVKYRPEFKSRLLDLQAHLWGQDTATRAAYLSWKYDLNPYTDKTYIYVAFCDAQLVGMVGAYGAKWEFCDAGQIFPGLCFADLVVHPDHRNQNLFPELMKFALDDLCATSYPYVFDLSAAPHVALVLLMQGWRSVFLQTAHRPKDEAKQCGQMRKIEQRLSWLASAYRQFCNYSCKQPMLAATYHRLRGHLRGLFSLRSDDPSSPFADLDSNADRNETNTSVALSKTPRPGAMAELAERIGTDGRIRHVRDKKYFSWRFQNPLSEYRFLFLEKECLYGYFVLHTKLGPNSDDAWTYIVDWEATNVQVWAELLQAAIHWGNFKELYIWSATLPDEVKTILCEAGFTFSDKTGRVHKDIHGENILMKPLCKKIYQSEWVLADLDLLNPTSWDLRMIYSDAY